MHIYDLIIIGSGPAGLAAAIYASRAELDFIIIERSGVSGGQVQSTYEVDNYPGMPGISGADLSTAMRNHCESLGANFITDEVKSISRSSQLFSIDTWDGSSYAARTVIAATGASHRHLGCQGEEDFAGMGVSYCATCDGAFFKGRKCAVIGGGDVAVEDALYLSKIARQVYLIHRRDEFRATPALVTEAHAVPNIEFLTPMTVEAVNGSDMVESIVLHSLVSDEITSLAVDGVFVAVGITPETELFKGLADCDEAGYIIAGENCATSCPGLYAAGDLRTKPLRQIITAAADGANAVTELLKYLKTL